MECILLAEPPENADSFIPLDQGGSHAETMAGLREQIEKGSDNLRLTAFHIEDIRSLESELDQARYQVFYIPGSDPDHADFFLELSR